MRVLAFLLLFSSVAQAQVETSTSNVLEQAKNSSLSIQVEQLQKTVSDLRDAMELMKEEAKTEALIQVNENVNTLKYAKLRDIENRVLKLEQDKPFFTVSPSLNSSKTAKFTYTAKKDGIATIVAKGSLYGLVAGNQAQVLYVNNKLMDTMGHSIVGDNVGSRSFQLAGQTYMQQGKSYQIMIKSTGEVVNNTKIIIMQP